MLLHYNFIHKSSIYFMQIVIVVWASIGIIWSEFDFIFIRFFSKLEIGILKRGHFDNVGHNCVFLVFSKKKTNFHTRRSQKKEKN